MCNKAEFDGTSYKYKLTVYNLGLSIAIAAINKAISKIMIKLAAVMKFNTVTESYSIQTMFTTIALFVNTTVVFTWV
jgi:hypothetical protein